MKTLKFREVLSKLILNGEKTTTWRLFDDKNLSEGDIISFLVWETGKEFAKAKLIEVREKIFENLTGEDFEGHEKFNSEKEKYDAFSSYYKRDVYKNSPIKIIKFELI
jgi:hypothetical protein